MISKQINILNELFFPMFSGLTSIVVLNSLVFSCRLSISFIVSVALLLPFLLHLVFFCLPRFCGRGAGLFLEHLIFLVQDPAFDAEVPPPVGGLQGVCTEIDCKLWDISQGLEMEDPCQHIVSHPRLPGWVVVYPSPVLVDLGTIFSKGSHR